MLGLRLDAQSSVVMLPGGNLGQSASFFECKFPPCSSSVELGEIVQCAVSARHGSSHRSLLESVERS